MILETQEEKKAFDFICNLASERTDRICNDLTNTNTEKFKNCIVPVADDKGKMIQRACVFDYDIIHWLKNRVK